jgi:chemotaxis methyl-accepting protein methylase
MEGEASRLLPYVCATNISPEALNAAKIGSYRRESFGTNTLGVLDRFFKPTADGFDVTPEIRRLVHFSRDNLTSGKSRAPADRVFGSFDPVPCRNGLIYTEWRETSIFWKPQALAFARTGETPVPPVNCALVLILSGPEKRVLDKL